MKRDDIWSGVTRYRKEYNDLASRKDRRQIREDSDLRPLIHNLLKNIGLVGVKANQSADIFWLEPEINLVGEIEKPNSSEFKGPPKGKPDHWGYPENRDRNVKGDGLAQLHRMMMEFAVTHGIHTNCELLRVYEHKEPYGYNCYWVKGEALERRCGFPKRMIKECDLISGTEDSIVPVLEFLMASQRR